MVRTDDGHQLRKILPFEGCGDCTPSAFKSFVMVFKLRPSAYSEKMRPTTFACSGSTSRRTPQITGLLCESRSDSCSMGTFLYPKQRPPVCNFRCFTPGVLTISVYRSTRASRLGKKNG